MAESRYELISRVIRIIWINEHVILIILNNF